MKTNTEFKLNDKVLINSGGFNNQNYKCGVIVDETKTLCEVEYQDGSTDKFIKRNGNKYGSSNSWHSVYMTECDHEVYTNYVTQRKIKNLWSSIRDYFNRSYDNQLTIDQLTRIKSIINE